MATRMRIQNSTYLSLRIKVDLVSSIVSTTASRNPSDSIMVNKRVRNAVLGCNLKNGRMISVHFKGKSFNITVIQAYAPTSNAEEAEVERYY